MVYDFLKVVAGGLIEANYEDMYQSYVSQAL